jgi:hypothetical protein
MTSQSICYNNRNFTNSLLLLLFVFITLGLFKYAVIHSGSPLAHWYLSECVQPSGIQHSVCKPGTTLISKRKTYEELMSESTYNIIANEIHIEVMFILCWCVMTSQSICYNNRNCDVR